MFADFLVFDGVLKPGLVLVVVVAVGVLLWFFGRNYGRKDAVRTIASRIWCPERGGSLRLVLCSGKEVDFESDGDGTCIFRYVSTDLPIALRFRYRIHGFTPHCHLTKGEGRKEECVAIVWRQGENCRDLVWSEEIQTGTRLVCTFMCYQVTERYPYLGSRTIVVEIVPRGHGDGTIGDDDETLP